MEDIYKNIDPENIPWNIASPPAALVELVLTRKILPCNTLEIGCGMGNSAIYLAQQGFTVTGIDISPTAIAAAHANAATKKVVCNFLLANILGDLKEFDQSFDFIFDWSVLHHIFPESRKAYVENVKRLLNPGGKYLSVCFSEEDGAFGGSGKYRETPIGTTLYFSSEDEIRDLFTAYFTILDLRTIEIEGKPEPHRTIYAFMEKSKWTKT